jgi:hypothetical protein
MRMRMRMMSVWEEELHLVNKCSIEHQMRDAALRRQEKEEK